MDRGTAGTHNWNDPENWDPNDDVPDFEGEYVLIDDVLTGDRTIIADAAFNPAWKLSAFSWFTHGGYVDKIKLATDFGPNGGYTATYPHYLANTSGDETKMVLDLAGYDMVTPHEYKVPAMTIMDSVGGSTLNVNDSIDIRNTNFTVTSGITIRLQNYLRIPGATLPNLTVYGDSTVIARNEAIGPDSGIISGDVTIEDGGFNAALGVLSILGDVNVASDTPTAGLSSIGGVTVGFRLEGDLIDHNTVNDNGSGGLRFYQPGRLFFSGNDPSGQIVDVHRESHMRLIIDPYSYVALANDYYAPYDYVPVYESLVDRWGTLDVGANNFDPRRHERRVRLEQR